LSGTETKRKKLRNVQKDWRGGERIVPTCRKGTGHKTKTDWGGDVRT